MSYVHLTTSERVKIETYLELGFSMRKIAQHLGRQPSTISRELKRNPSYNAINAGLRYEMQKRIVEYARCSALRLAHVSFRNCERHGLPNRSPDGSFTNRDHRTVQSIDGYIKDSSRAI